MLRANVGLSRKMSRDFNSTGFSLNLEGEILATLDDHEAVIERIQELYSLAEEALDRQIAESREIDAFARRDAEHHPEPARDGRANGRHPEASREPSPSRNGQRETHSAGNEPATNKQVQFLLTLAKRQKLQGPKLEARIEEILGKACSPYDLSKHEAGQVIEALNPGVAGANRTRR